MNARTSKISGPALVIAALLSACLVPIATEGSLSIQITNSVNARTLLPAIDMAAAGFTVSGVGPDGATFSQTTTGGAVTVDHLAFGSWSVTVDALNAAGTIIGSGQATVIVHTGETTTVEITVVPLEGNGALSLTVSWTASQVEYPSLQAALTPPSGTEILLSFGVAGNQATCSSTTIPAGYQTLTLQLLDNGIPVMGAVEVVRIVAGQTTSGSYAFENVNQPGGAVVVNITPAMADPIPVSISGVPSTITVGTSVTATASAGDGTTNVVYVWYVNGVSQATGSLYTFGSVLEAGYYRIDVTAYTADGTRAGSATATLQVVAGGVTPPSGNVTYPLAGFYLDSFDVSNDGSVTAAGMQDGVIRAMLFNPDGTVKKQHFVVSSYDTATYEWWLGMDVARAGQTGQTAITWSFGNNTSEYNWQTWVAFLDAAGNLIGAPHLLDPGAQTGINRIAKVRMSDNGVSAFIYEAQSQDCDRLVIYNADGSNRAALDIGSGIIMTGAMGNAIGMNRATGDIIVAAENHPYFYYQRFHSDGTPVDATMVRLPQIEMASQLSWSISFTIEYNETGNVAFLAYANWNTPNYKIAFFNPDMSCASMTAPLGINGMDVLVTAENNFIARVNGLTLYSGPGQYMDNVGIQGERIDRWNNIYARFNDCITRVPFPF